MIALPFPQRSTVPMVLSARFTAPLSPNGYDFGAVEPVDLVNVSSGYLYRILSYSWAVEAPEGDYIAAQLNAHPMGFQLRTTGNMTDILAKPIPAPIFQREARLLQHPADNAFQLPDIGVRKDVSAHAVRIRDKRAGRQERGEIGTGGGFACGLGCHVEEIRQSGGGGGLHSFQGGGHYLPFFFLERM